MRNRTLSIVGKAAGIAAIGLLAAAVRVAPMVGAEHGDTLRSLAIAASEAVHLPLGMLGIDGPPEGRADGLGEVRLAAEAEVPLELSAQPAAWMRDASAPVTYVAQLDESAALAGLDVVGAIELFEDLGCEADLVAELAQGYELPWPIVAPRAPGLISVDLRPTEPAEFRTIVVKAAERDEGEAVEIRVERAWPCPSREPTRVAPTASLGAD